jgi:hypothetical protein
MPTPPLADDVLEQTAEIYRAHGFQASAAAAAAAGVPLSTFKSRVRVAAERGILGTKPVLPGFRLTKTTAVTDADGAVVREFVQQRPEAGEAFRVPDGHVVKGVSALLDPDGRELAKWVKTREGEIDPLAIAEWIKQAFTDYQPAAPVAPAPQVRADHLLTLYPLADWHIGMFGWHREVGQNWDLKIAEQTICGAVDAVVARSPAGGTAVMLGGGDLLHSDNNDNKTARSGNALQVDGRYQKTLETACRLVVHSIDAALRRHERVIVRILPGNHDEHAAVAVAYFLLAWYRNEPRVTVDADPSLFWWYRFGKVLLGATHGHTVKIKDMPAIMAHRRAEDWGVTKYRYVHGFHLHHKEQLATEGKGVVCEIHQTPIPQDAWHFGAGFLSGRSVKSVTYHQEFGEVGSAREAILDVVEAPPLVPEAGQQ